MEVVTPDQDHETRPWGEFFVLSDETTHKVKRMVVRPGARLSYQRHDRRSEHWFVVAGCALVTLDGTQHTVRAGEAIDVPQTAAHRVENAGEDDLVFIEVQHGSYFGEDDITRLDDDYGRVS